MKTVLFACTHNAGRSQMAAALVNALANPSKVHAVSAGTQPAERVHPEVVEAMREMGIELSHATPALLTDTLAARADLLVTMGCGEACPLVPGLRHVEWDLPDPKGLPLARVREIREDIRGLVGRLMATEGWEKA